MPRSWEDNRYEGGLGDLADDDAAFDDSGTVDLGAGTSGGRFNVTEGGRTVSDEEVRENPDRYQITGNDTVRDLSQPADQPANSGGWVEGLSGPGQTTYLLAAAAAAGIVYWGWFM